MKNKLTAIVTSAMLIFTTSSLPSYALNASEHSVSVPATKLETTPVDNVSNQISNGTGTNKVKGQKGEFLIAQERWVRQQVVLCNRHWAFNRRYRRWVVVRSCRTTWKRDFVRYH